MSSGGDPIAPHHPVVLVVGVLAMVLGLAGLASWSQSYNALEGKPHKWLAEAPIGIAKPIAVGDGPIQLSDFHRVSTIPEVRYIETDIRRIPSKPVEEGKKEEYVLVAIHDLDGATEPLSLMERPTDDANTYVDESQFVWDVATLEELLTDPLLADVRWNLELKGGDVDTAKDMKALLSSLNVWGRVCISYGDIRSQTVVNSIRDEFAKVHVNVCSCASFPEKSAMFDWRWAQGLTAPLRPVAANPVSCIQILHDLITKRDVEEAHRAGLCIHAWELLLPNRYLGQDLPTEIQGVTEVGLMDEARMHELLDLGVDGIMTYRPDVLAKVLADRPLSTVDHCVADAGAVSNTRPAQEEES